MNGLRHCEGAARLQNQDGDFVGLSEIGGIFDFHNDCRRDASHILGENPR
jgi:hypothetical protein